MIATPDPAYRALALQIAAQSVNGDADPAAARARIAAGIERLARQVAASKRFVGADLALVVLPEYALSGFPMGEPIPLWRDKAALDPNGPEYRALGRIAADNGIYLAGNGYERDPHFPDIYFQACFVFDPAGGRVLSYRRLISMFAPSPWDVWDRYVAIHGIESVLPVAETAIGRLGAIASEEILYPEIARLLALEGAEILLHSSSEVGSPRPTQKGVAKQARAAENLAYVVSANTGGLTGTAIPANSTDGGSQIVDPEGRVLVEAGPGESMVAVAELDLGSLRRLRGRTGMGNMLARQPTELWAALYGRHTVQPPNGLLGAGGAVTVPDRGYFAERQSRVIAARRAAGHLA